MRGKHCLRTYSGTQKFVTLSSGEAELMALADHTDVVMCMRTLLAELGLLQGATTVHEDNTAAISILNDTKYDGRTKHVDYRIKSVRERVLARALEISYISTDLQLADLFTKPLPRATHDRLATTALNGGDIDLQSNRRKSRDLATIEEE